MATVAPTEQIRASVAAALRGRKRDVAGQVFQLALLATLLVSSAS